MTLPSNMQELTAYKNWIVSGADKIPWRVDGSARASSTNPLDWATYEEAALLCVVHPKLTPGFVLTNTPYCVIDLDASDDPTVLRTHTEIFNRFNSCCEVSVSGRGAHIWIKGTLPEGVRSSKHKVEVYSSDRYIKTTGNVANSTQIMERQTLLNELYNEIKAAQSGTNRTAEPVPNQAATQSDEKIKELASQASNGDKFLKLWNGDFITDYPSHSEADMALCNIIAFYTEDRQQVARMWASSPLGQSQPKRTRKKWVMDMVNKSFDQKVPPIDPVLAAKLTEEIKQQIQVQNKEVSSAYTDWTVPPGMVGQIATFIYQSAYSPLKEVALAGAIAYYAGLMGRAYNVSGFGLNQYIVVLAKTGQGKEAAKTGISKINRAVGEMLGEGIDIYDFMGPEMIASAQGLFNRIGKTPCCVSILPEFGLLLQAICDRKAHQNEKNIRSAFLKLYSSSGKAGHIGKSAYSDMTKNSIDIKSPSFSILGESTPSNFYKAVDEYSVSDGFLPRLTLIEYSGDAPTPNDKHHYVQPDPNMLMLLQSQIRQNQSTEALNTPVNVTFSPDADKFYNDLRVTCRKACDEHNRNNQDHLAEIWTRVAAKVIKLAALIAVGVNSVEPEITLADIQWAHDLVMHGVNMLTDRFKAGDLGESNWQFEQSKLMQKQIQSYLLAEWTEKFGKNYRVTKEAKESGIITYHYLNTQLSKRPPFKNSPDGKRGLDSTIQMMVDSGGLVEVKNDMLRAGRTGKMWRVVD